MTDSKTNLIIDSKKDSKTMLKITCAALEDKKAFDIKIIDISKISTLCDYIVIADGTNKKHRQREAHAARHHQGGARNGVLPFGGVLPGNRARAHRGGD